MNVHPARVLLRGLLALALGLALGVGAGAQTRPKVLTTGIDRPASSLYIGNSFFYYNNSLHGHVNQLVLAGMGGFRHRATSVTISGSGFDWHDVDSYFRPDAVGTYSFDAANNVVFNKPGERLFDLAILMDCSQCPLHPQLKGKFREYAKRHADTVRKHGARPVFFMSWAYQDVPAMTDELAQAYTQAGNDNEAFVIPAGLAFARSVAARPELNLYAPDKRHPSLAGTYLAACTTYASLFRQSPVGSAYTAGLDPAVARHLQTVAWDTVQAYHGQRTADSR
ncbi:MAG TPA: hypothetical protein VFE82_09770 [Ramlibacter sp.]|uniref:hypothetical protein n=1 Tax=Ramlibacter sp. TaxID=1917967 RepID=UPI002D682816|nr:hypothetical protein [Ramlibacter sp.]HZY18760.1 hypothetical protein [Ramlibacter sp.]